MTKKVSVSLPDADITYLKSVSLNRSEAIHIVIEKARSAELIDEYVDAYSEWKSSPDGADWDSASGDGVE